MIEAVSAGLVTARLQVRSALAISEIIVPPCAATRAGLLAGRSGLDCPVVATYASPRTGLAAKATPSRGYAAREVTASCSAGGGGLREGQLTGWRRGSGDHHRIGLPGPLRRGRDPLGACLR